MTADRDDLHPLVELESDRLVEELRALVARKREAGEYPPELIRRLEAPDGVDRREGEVARVLAEVRHSANFTSLVTTESKRPLIAPLVSRGRQLIRASLSWYMNGVLAQVRTFGRRVEDGLALLAAQNAELERRLAAIEERLAELERRGSAAVDERADGSVQ